jgi:hypothetical protein
MIQTALAPANVRTDTDGLSRNRSGNEPNVMGNPREKADGGTA